MAFPAQAGADDSDDGWLITGQAENEFFVPGRNDDRYYTQGLQLNLITPASRTPLKGLAMRIKDPFEFARQLVDRKAPPPGPYLGKDARVRGSLVIGQNIYTPEDLTLLEPDPKDRPYAGWIYVGADIVAEAPDRLSALQLQVGLVGPSALGGWAQNGWHRHVNHIAEAQGWSYQLHDEPAFVLYGERRRRWSTGHATGGGPLKVDIVSNLNFALGTVQTSVGGGGMVRLGVGLQDDLGPPRIRPAPVGSSYFHAPRSAGVSGYLFAGADMKLVARDIFLDGNTFQDSRSVDKRPMVGEVQTGMVLRAWRLRVTYAQVWRSEEFLGQNGTSRFGALTVGYYQPLR